MSFQRALELTPSDSHKKAVVAWQNKTQLELNNPNVGNINNAAYLKGSKPAPNQPQEANEKPPPAAPSEEVRAPVPAEAAEKPTAKAPEGAKFVFEWYQSMTHVFISLKKQSTMMAEPIQQFS